MSSTQDVQAQPSRAHPSALVETPVSAGSARLRGVLLLGPASGFLLYLAYPPANRPYLAWIALTPLLGLTARGVGPRVSYLSAWFGGLVFWVLSLSWIWELHPAAWLAWVALAVYQSVFWPLFLGMARAATLRWRWPLVIAAPICWVGCEYIQAHALSGFPWYYLAHSQYRFVELIQVSDVVGAWGVSFVLMAANAAIYQLARAVAVWRGGGVERRRAWMLGLISLLVAGGLVGGTLWYGHARVREASFRPGPRVLLLQSNMQQAMKMNLDHDQIIGMFADLIRQAYARDAKGGVDLVVWPETSYPPGWTTIEAGASLGDLDRAARQLQADTTPVGWLNRRKEATTELNLWARELNAPMLVGVPCYTLGSTGGYKSNGAAWIDGDAANPPKIYHKMHLVPFGEYIPFVDIAPWIKRLAPYDEDRVPKLRAGSEPVWFDAAGYRYASAICFEDTLPHVVRRFFREAPEAREPDVLVNMSNDGWFNGSAEHDLHLAIGVFRCVENRVPLVRVANMGYSAIVDGNGRVVRSLPKKTSGTLTETVPLDDRRSLYSQSGDWLAIGCFVVSVLSVAMCAFPVRWLRRPPRGAYR